MSRCDENSPCAPQGRLDQQPPVPGRINVAVNVGMFAAIQRVIEQDGVTLTEAVRRLIAYGDVVHEVAREPRSTLIVRTSCGDEREVVIL